MPGCKKISGNLTTYPTDELLERSFYSNKEDFNRLIKNFQEDSSLFLVNQQGEVTDFSGNKTNLSTPRINEYKRLLTKLNVLQINRTDYDQSIFLQVWQIPNFFIGGKFKYYVFTETPPKDLQTSLDEIYKSGRDANEFKKIEGTWYLYLDVW
jgi:hypothetical protein